MLQKAELWLANFRFTSGFLTMGAAATSRVFVEALFFFIIVFDRASAAGRGRNYHHWRQGRQFGSGGNEEFVRVSGTEFSLNSHPMFINGFNAYWVTYYSFELSTRPHVSGVFKDASDLGLNVARAWAFNDGGYHAIQTSPGNYSEDGFKGLDFVIAEAQSYGVRLLLSLSNNYENYGGKPQYAQWARNAGHSVDSDDAFFYDSVIKSYYKDYVKAVLTRINSITGVAYKDDPTIFAWELINEPRCSSDPAGKTLQAWIEEMSSYVKSIDSNHLLEVGLEGFYSAADLERSMLGSWSSDLGTDFIRNHQAPGIDFATVHCYPDSWRQDESFEDQLSFQGNWIQNHIEDANQKLKKPLLVAEFGKSSKAPGFVVEQRDRFYAKTYSSIFSSSSEDGGDEGGRSASGAGALLWQLVPQSLASALDDGFVIVASEDHSTVSVIAKQSQTVSVMNSGRS